MVNNIKNWIKNVPCVGIYRTLSNGNLVAVETTYRKVKSYLVEGTEIVRIETYADLDSLVVKLDLVWLVPRYQIVTSTGKNFGSPIGEISDAKYTLSRLEIGGTLITTWRDKKGNWVRGGLV
jgi:hypothetical protein